jgi:hypothetical protein
MATTDTGGDGPDDDTPTHRAFTAKLAQQPPETIREICADNFLVAANVLTYNWIEGNPRTDWDGKPFDWHPVAGEGETVHHFRHWYSQIQTNAANMFLSARKHTKTTFADCLMIWRSEYTPGHQSLYWANTRKQVKDRMEEFEEIAAANPWLQNVDGGGALLSKSFDNGAGIDTTWVTGGYEGGHVDLQLGDDPMKELGDISDSDVEHWYGNVIVPTLNPGNTLQAIIGTRKRPNDLYEILRKRHDSEDFESAVPGYNLVEYPAIREVWQQEYDRPGDLAPKHLYEPVEAPDLANALDVGSDTLHLLWPQARSPEFYLRNLGMQGRRYFLREFCMVYTQLEDAIVHRAWIDRTSTDRAPPVDAGDAWRPMHYPDDVTRPDFDRVVVGHDPAGAGRDRFAFVTVGVLTHRPQDLPPQYDSLTLTDDGDHKPVQLRHLLDVWQAQEVPPSRWRDKLTALHDRYTPDSIAIESNLNATWTADDDALPQRVRSAITPIATTRRKHSWKDGVPSIGSDIEAGNYRFYEGGECMTDALVTALTSVQMNDGELVGHTPDLVMALYMAHKRLQSDHLASSKTDLRYGRDERSQERERKDREKRRDLKGSAVGDAILQEQDRQQNRY